MTEKNQIALEKPVLAALYKNVLVDVGTKSEIPELAPIAPAIKNIRVITLCDTQQLPENQYGFLTAILKACNIKIQDIELSCLSKGQTYIYNKPENIVYKKTLLFGVLPEAIALPMRFPFFQIQQFEKTFYLSAPDLTSIEQDKKLKVELWQCLQKLFI
jgi:hypothetical protein